MALRSAVVLVICVALAVDSYHMDGQRPTYEPTWDSLDTRPNPGWYDEAKFGIFIHWGISSVPAFGNESFWQGLKANDKDYVKFMRNYYKPGFTYQEFANEFTAENYKPDEWVQLFENSGAKYVVLTGKHPDGFALWPSKYSFSWNSVDIGPKRDLVGELATAVRKSNKMRFGLYHSLYEWFNPMYLSDNATKFKSTEFVDKKVFPEMKELVTKYKPEYLWSDGDYEAPDRYWRSTTFIAWLFNDSPVADTVLVNDRWGKQIPCKHGSVRTCKDNYHPGRLVEHKWENRMSICKTGSNYRQDAALKDYKTSAALIEDLVSTVSFGGNLLLNIGPTKDGRIVPIFEERLLDIGNWLKVNGDAIYGSKPWDYQTDPRTAGVWYTSKNSRDKMIVYAIGMKYPTSNKIELYGIRDVIKKVAQVRMLGVYQTIKYDVAETYVTVYFPPTTDISKASTFGWTFSFQLK